MRKFFVSYQFTVGNNSLCFGCMDVDVQGQITNFETIRQFTEIATRNVERDLPEARGIVKVCILFWREFEAAS